MTIHNYHGYQRWSIQKTSQDDLDRDFTFGFELEVTSDSSTNITPYELSQKINLTFGDLFVCERDSSIGVGVEIISQPMTWRYFLENLDTFKKLIDLCNQHNFQSHKGNVCGLHVHIGRRALGGKYNGAKLDENKVVTNMYYIMERFDEPLFKFSRRTSRRWCESQDSEITLDNGNSFIDKRTLYNLVHSHENVGRYQTLNLRNEKTVEVRTWRGTLKWETFFLTMNLTKNIVQESRVPSNSVNFNELVFKGLNEEMQEYAETYLQNRRIDKNSKNCTTLIALEDTVVQQRKDMSNFNISAMLSALNED